MNILAIDITAVIISAIGAIVSLGTVALTLMINKKVDKVAKDVNGKITQLLESKDELTIAKESASLAKGKLEGMAANDPNIKDISNDAATNKITPVVIVDQEKPVEVTQKKTKPKT